MTPPAVQHADTDDTQHLFNARENDWGFTSFMPLGELYDPSSGYLMNDTLIIEAEVLVRRMVDYWTYDSKKKTGYVGLKNQGATCYMNSLLQTLYHIPYFRKAVYHMPTAENDMPSGSIPLALQCLFYKLQYSDTSVATKELTKSFVWDTCDSFLQHDVQELNRVLCEKLEDKMKETVVEGTVQKLFEGHHMNYIECINVDNKSTRKESFYDLQLDVKGCPDVYASIDKYVEVERLEGDNKYHAEQYGLQVGQLREISNKVHNAELKLFSEVECGPDLCSIAPPEKTTDDILLFFKLYYPEKEELSYVGRLLLNSTGNPSEILARIKKTARYDPDEEIGLYEEIKFEPYVMCEPIEKKLTFRVSQLEDGDIICFQKAPAMDNEEHIRYPDVPSYLEYVHNCQVVHFRSLNNPNQNDFCLEMSRLFTYDDVVERVAEQLGLDDPSKIRLTRHNCYSQQPKPQPIKYRGVEHLSDMLTSAILYYEVLDTPLPKLEVLKTLKVSFHHATTDEVVIHTIRLPKESTVRDVLDDLQTKVELSRPEAELRLLVFYQKIYKVFPSNEKIENINDQHWTLRAEEVEIPLPEPTPRVRSHDGYTLMTILILTMLFSLSEGVSFAHETFSATSKGVILHGDAFFEGGSVVLLNKLTPTWGAMTTTGSFSLVDGERSCFSFRTQFSFSIKTPFNPSYTEGLSLFLTPSKDVSIYARGEFRIPRRSFIGFVLDSRAMESDVGDSQFKFLVDSFTPLKTSTLKELRFKNDLNVNSLEVYISSSTEKPLSPAFIASINLCRYFQENSILYAGISASSIDHKHGRQQ